MISHEFADHFSQDWIDSWNSHDLPRILSHYTDDFEMSSPYISQLTTETSGILKGKDAVAAYWTMALKRIPDLHFSLYATLAGADSLVIYYQGHRGMAAEVFFFNSSNKVIKACAHYGQQK